MSDATGLNDKIVVFMGAGASAHAGYPVMDRFLEVLRSLQADRTTHQSSRGSFAFQVLLGFRARVGSVRDYVSADFDNIEALYSTAEMFALAYPDEILVVGGRNIPAKDIPEQIALAIWEIYRKRPLNQPLDQSQTHQQTLIFCLHGLKPERRRQVHQRLTFITTNYDLLLELAMWGRGVPFSYGRGVPLAGASNGPGKNGVPILKLHGSVNWFTDQSGSTEFDFEIGVMDGGLSDNRFVRWPVVQSAAYEIKGGRTPLIVPPTYAKHASCLALQYTWKEAMVALSEAQLIAFVGYSFPQTDTFLQHLLYVGLLQNHGLRRVIVINPDQDVGGHVQKRVFNEVFAGKEHRFVFRKTCFDDSAAEYLATEIADCIPAIEQLE